MKALFVNGSPRKKWNTAQLLESAMKGAEVAGAEVEMIHLNDVAARGCTSCFACKRLNSKTNGLCAMRDDLTPMLRKALEADIIVVGSPVYFDYCTPMTKAYLERLMFPVSAYKYDKRTGEAGASLCERFIPTAIIYTMNMPEEWFHQSHYPATLGANERYLRKTYGYSETLCSFDTLQFDDYSCYDIETFKEEDKRRHRDEQFPRDLQKAYELGQRLVRLAKEGHA